MGESGIVSVGSTEKIDGTKGDQPRGNQILRNLIHEVGIFGKQTAGYVQAMSCQTTLKHNGQSKPQFSYILFAFGENIKD